MSLIDEGEVGAEKKRMMGFLPVDTCVYLSGAEKVSGPTVEISVNLDCSNRAGGSKDRTVSEREACCRYSTWVVSRVPTPFGISNECVWGFNFGAATVHAPKVLLPRCLFSEPGSGFCISWWRVFTCCRPRRWGPVGQPGRSLVDASSASLPGSWWGSPPGPRWPPLRRWGGAPPGPRWWRVAPGPRPPAPSR